MPDKNDPTPTPDGPSAKGYDGKASNKDQDKQLKDMGIGKDGGEKDKGDKEGKE